VTAEADAVRQFYAGIWEAGDFGLMSVLLHEDLTFRGTLGQDIVGRDGFEAYVRDVRGALDGYRCEILDLLAEPGKAAARMRFGGRHILGPLLGVPPTGRDLHWDGAAFFTFNGTRICDLWVVGDMMGLREQLAA